MKNTRLVALLCMLVACASVDRQTTVRIASDATFAPFHYLDAAGLPTGFDIELARAVVRQSGKVPEIIVLPYAELFSGLLAGSHDMIAATTGITAERQQIYTFSQAYFRTCQVAVVRAGQREPRKVRDLAGLRIGAAGSGTSAKAMRSIAGVHTPIEDGQGVAALFARNIDAWIVDEFDGVRAAQASGGQLRVLAEGIAEEQYGFVLAPGSVRLRNELNKSLARLAANGELEILLADYGVNRGADWPVRCGS